MSEEQIEDVEENYWRTRGGSPIQDE
jgi:hypothetical protein